ncbi:MAG: TIGR03987 family protein [Bifidobacteriaceae bacterium]|jgi:uncharacterized repeat protein (TIGR03987 family)|nr:TIGR03987 family protein [Bifidobacteriaceae bacterium]
MDPLTIAAVIIITLALIFYTTGVFAERHAGILKWSHTIWFGLGLASDTVGTTIMTYIASTSTTKSSLFPFHQITGYLAIVLMAFHFIWALVSLGSQRQNWLTNFHKFSVIVWSFWLIPYLAGMIMGMIGD